MADEQKEQPKFTPPDLDTLKQDSQSIFENLNDISKLITDSAKELSKATGDSAASYKSSFGEAIKLVTQFKSALLERSHQHHIDLKQDHGI